MINDWHKKRGDERNGMMKLALSLRLYAAVDGMAHLRVFSVTFLGVLFGMVVEGLSAFSSFA